MNQSTVSLQSATSQFTVGDQSVYSRRPVSLPVSDQSVYSRFTISESTSQNTQEVKNERFLDKTMCTFPANFAFDKATNKQTQI